MNIPEGYEFKYEYDRTIPLRAGSVSCNAVRIFYRKIGTRRWTKFLLVGDPEETLQSLDAKIDGAIYAHMNR